jgi:hypothetical protein
MSGCFGKVLKFGLIIVGVLVAIVIIAAIASPPSSRRSTSSVRSAAVVSEGTPLAPATPTKTVDEIKTASVDIAYKDLYRNIETHVGKILHATGQIVQAQKQAVVFGDEYTIFRVNITKDEYGNYSDTVWLEYHGNERFLEDDTIEFWATVDGLEEYESIMGGQVELPRLIIDTLELIQE